MNIKSEREVKIELDGNQVRKIVDEYISKHMTDLGYELKTSRLEDGQMMPDMFFRGQLINPDGKP